jgi:hypothetical protein
LRATQDGGVNISREISDLVERFTLVIEAVTPANTRSALAILPVNINLSNGGLLKTNVGLV